MALFRESSDLSWAPWNSRESDSSSIRERLQFSTGRAELFPHMNRAATMTEKQIPRYTRRGAEGEVVVCRERAASS